MTTGFKKFYQSILGPELIQTEDQRRRTMIIFFILLALPIVYYSGIFHLIKGETVEGGLNFVTGFFLTGTLWYVRKNRNFTLVTRVNLGVFSIFLVYIISVGGENGSRLLWAYIYPLIAFFLLNAKEGIIWIGSMLAVIGFILFLPDCLWPTFNYPGDVRVRFVVSFIIVTGMSYIFESLRERYHKALSLSIDRYQALTEELKASLEQLKTTQDRLVQAEKMASLGNLVAGVAHEINTPLSVGLTASSYYEIATSHLMEAFEQDRLTRSEFRKFINQARDAASLIQQNLDRAAELVNNFKRIAVGHADHQKRRFNLKAHFQDVIATLKPKLEDYDARVSIDCPPDLMLVNYPDVFYHVFSNLVMNSLVHGFEAQGSGKIRIEATVSGNELLILYHDNGAGMDEATRKKAFDPFFTTRRGQGGCGLGLHIVYNMVVNLLEGRIECLNNPEGGATFQIGLPFDHDVPEPPVRK